MRDQTGMLAAAAALEADPEDRRMRRARQPFEPAEARERNARVAVLGARERVARRQVVIHRPFLIGRPDGADEGEYAPST